MLNTTASTTATLQRRLLRVPEVARICGLSRATVCNLIRRGELPVVRIGRATRVAVEDVEALVRRNRVGLFD